MKWELYLSRQEWEEIKAAVRERAPKDHRGRPCCEFCKRPHGKLKRNEQGYMVPHWLHTAHARGAPMRSKDPRDYLALCDACHMWYDRQPGDSGFVTQYRRGYSATTTDQLVAAVGAIGLEVWQQGEGWYWQIGVECGVEDSPVLAIAAAVARLARVAGVV